TSSSVLLLSQASSAPSGSSAHGIDMNLSAEQRPSKCPNGSIWRWRRPMVTAAIAVLLACQSAAVARQRGPFFDLFGDGPPKLRGSLHTTHVPRPSPRPDEAPKAEPPAPAAPEPPKPSACRLALTEEIAIAPSVPDISGPGGCGGTDLVRLEAIVLPNKHRVAVTPAATLRCTMASAIADWVRTDVMALAAQPNSEPSVLANF